LDQFPSIKLVLDVTSRRVASRYVSIAIKGFRDRAIIIPFFPQKGEKVVHRACVVYMSSYYSFVFLDFGSRNNCAGDLSERFIEFTSDLFFPQRREFYVFLGPWIAKLQPSGSSINCLYATLRVLYTISPTVAVDAVKLINKRSHIFPIKYFSCDIPRAFHNKKLKLHESCKDMIQHFNIFHRRIS